MITLTIPINELRAAALFASTDMTRYILNAVLLQLRPSGHPVTLVATDGRRIAAIKSNAEVVAGEIPAKVTNVIIPIGLLKRVRAAKVKLRAQPRLAYLKIEPLGESDLTTGQAPQRFRITFDDLEHQISAKSVEGHFPKYAEVFPTGPIVPSATPISVNGKYLALLNEAGALLNGSNVPPALLLTTTAEHAPIIARLAGIKEFAAVIMPVRVTPEVNWALFATPEWTCPPKEEPPQVLAPVSENSAPVEAAAT